MKDLLVLTVGTQKEPIIVSIRDKKPSKILFIASKETKKHISEIETELEKECVDCIKGISSVECISNENDVERCWTEIRGHVNEFMRKNDASPSDISIDFTCGTKAMVGALLLVACEMEVGSLRYVGGERDENGGRVISGHERIQSLKPRQISDERRISEIKSLFKMHRFDACSRIADELFDKNYREFYKSVSEFYRMWDNFNHEKALCVLESALSSSKNCLNDDQRRVLVPNNEDFLKKLIEDTKSQKYSIYEIVDLLENAKRRLDEGKYDDAVARCYRLTEFLVQYALYNNNPKIETSNVDLILLNQPRFNENFGYLLKDPAHKNRKSIQLPSKLAYDFLRVADPNHPLIKKYDEYWKNGLEKLLNSRNDSILAHGTSPVMKETAEKFVGMVAELCKSVFKTEKEFEELRSRTRFLQF